MTKLRKSFEEDQFRKTIGIKLPDVLFNFGVRPAQSSFGDYLPVSANWIHNINALFLV